MKRRQDYAKRFGRGSDRRHRLLGRLFVGSKNSPTALIFSDSRIKDVQSKKKQSKKKKETSQHNPTHPHIRRTLVTTPDSGVVEGLQRSIVLKRPNGRVQTVLAGAVGRRLGQEGETVEVAVPSDRTGGCKGGGEDGCSGGKDGLGGGGGESGL